MGKKKNQFYVVWAGQQPGIYRSWSDCERQVKGFPNARYKGFPSAQLADQAWQDGAEGHWGQKSTATKPGSLAYPQVPEALCVDAACNMQTGWMQYRGVWLHSGQKAFARGPYPNASNNIGEYLALVHALIYLRRRGQQLPIYSDSLTALSWLQKKRINSEVINSPGFNQHLRARALTLQNWLRQRGQGGDVRKWNTPSWGEIPADYGNKR